MLATYERIGCNSNTNIYYVYVQTEKKTKRLRKLQWKMMASSFIHEYVRYARIIGAGAWARGECV